MDFARILVNHGCPVKVQNNAGKTARDVLTNMSAFDSDHPSLKELFHLLSPPISPLRLEEMASRNILQVHIPSRASASSSKSPASALQKS